MASESYEERMKKFIEENSSALEELKKISKKMKKVKIIESEFKDEVIKSLEENNLNGYSDNELTISLVSESERFGFKKSLTKEEKEEAYDYLLNNTDYFERASISPHWTWRFSN